MAGRTLNIDIKTTDQQTLAALKRLERQLKDVGTSVDNVDRRGRRMGDMFGALAVGAGLRYIVTEAEEAQTSMRSTQAVIESTGNAAEVSAEQQAKLVDELARLGGVDDEVVNAGANMLRTFTEVKGANFGDTLAAALDIAAMKGQDLSTVAEQLGKALNDPVQGMNRLTRMGVVLTDSQKELIRSLAETGDVAGAQRVILAELEREYGGQAEANATSSGKFKVAVDDLAESVGTSLLPAMSTLADVGGSVAEVFGAMPGPVQTGIVALVGLTAAGNKASDMLGDTQLNLKTTVGEFGKFNSAMAAGIAGLTAYGTALSVLENSVKFSGDVSQAATDLEQFANGTATSDEAVSEFAGSIDALAEKFKMAYGNSGYGDRLFTGQARAIRSAQSDIEALDDTFAQLVESGNVEEAQKAYGKLAAELTAAGVSTEDIVNFMPDYWEALDRAARGGDTAAQAATGHKDALVVEADAVAKATDKLNARRDALAKVNEETEKAVDLALGGFASTQDYEAAVSGTREAQLALAQARAEGDPAKIAKAEEDLENAMVRQAEAAAKVWEAQALANGEQLTGQARAQILTAEMGKAREMTGYWSDDLDVLSGKLGEVAKEHQGKVTLNTEDAKRKLNELIALQMILAHEQDPSNPLPGAPFLPYGTPGTMGPPSPPRNLAAGGKGLVVNSTTNIGTVQVGGVRGLADLTAELDRRDRTQGRAVLRMVS